MDVIKLKDAPMQNYPGCEFWDNSEVRRVALIASAALTLVGIVATLYTGFYFVALPATVFKAKALSLSFTLLSLALTSFCFHAYLYPAFPSFEEHARLVRNVRKKVIEEGLGAVEIFQNYSEKITLEEIRHYVVENDIKRLGYEEFLQKHGDLKILMQSILTDDHKKILRQKFFSTLHVGEGGWEALCQRSDVRLFGLTKEEVGSYVLRDFMRGEIDYMTLSARYGTYIYSEMEENNLFRERVETEVRGVEECMQRARLTSDFVAEVSQLSEAVVIDFIRRHPEVYLYGQGLTDKDVLVRYGLVPPAWKNHIEMLRGQHEALLQEYARSCQNSTTRDEEIRKKIEEYESQKEQTIARDKENWERDFRKKKSSYASAIQEYEKVESCYQQLQQQLSSKETRYMWLEFIKKELGCSTWEQISAAKQKVQKESDALRVEMAGLERGANHREEKKRALFDLESEKERLEELEYFIFSLEQEMRCLKNEMLALEKKQSSTRHEVDLAQFKQLDKRYKQLELTRKEQGGEFTLEQISAAKQQVQQKIGALRPEMAGLEREANNRKEKENTLRELERKKAWLEQVEHETAPLEKEMQDIKNQMLALNEKRSTMRYELNLGLFEEEQKVRSVVETPSLRYETQKAFLLSANEREHASFRAKMQALRKQFFAGPTS